MVTKRQGISPHFLCGVFLLWGMGLMGVPGASNSCPYQHSCLQGEKGRVGAHWAEGRGLESRNLAVNGGHPLPSPTPPDPGCSGHRCRRHGCPSLLAALSGRLRGGCSLGAGLVVTFPGCGREPLLSTLETRSGPRRALSSLPPARLAAMWQGGPPALGGPPQQTRSHVRAAAQGARPLPCKVSELESGNRCRNVVMCFRTNAMGCSLAAGPRVPCILPSSGAGSSQRRASLGAGPGWAWLGHPPVSLDSPSPPDSGLH